MKSSARRLSPAFQRTCAAAASIGALLLSVAPAAGVPAVASTRPVDQKIGVSLSANIIVNFVGSIDAATLTPDNILVTTNLRGKVTGQLTWKAGIRRLVFDPDQDFRAGERVLVTVTKGVEDFLGNPLARGHHFQFATWTAPQPDGGFVTSPTSWPIGSIALSLTAGDLDGDGLPEGIFANTVPDSLTIWRPDGLGGFTSFAQLSTHTLPRHSVLTDVDEDGLNDIVVATSSDTVDVFRNQGSGTFVRDMYAVPSGTTPYGGFVADLDADGDLDIATANFNGHNISVLLNQGDGTYGTSAEYAAGDSADSPRYVDGADFDGDGDVDLACCNGYSYDVSILINDGDGVFTADQNLIPVGESPNFLEARDYSGDGLVDLVTVNSISETLSFLRGNGDGTFQPTVEHVTGGPFPFGITSVDVDGDGDLDVVVPIRGLDGWRVMWNDGAGNFSQGTLHLGGVHCHSIAAADWDDDGDIDVLAGFAISNDMYYYEQVPTPVVVATTPAVNVTGAPVTNPVTVFFSVDLDPATVTAGAFQVVGSQSGPRTVTAAWDGVQKAVVLTPAAPFFPGEIVCVTSNGSGMLVSTDGLAHDGHSFEFMTAGGVSAATFGTQHVKLPGSDPVAVVAADLDGDDSSDLAVANFLSNDVTLLLTGNGGLPAISSSVGVDLGPVDLWTADLDGNGFVDVVCANTVSRTVSLLMNQGGASFQAATPLVTAGAPFAISGGDFDQDGDPDLAVTEIGPDGVTILWNDGTGAFPTSDSLAVGGSPLDLAVADLDRDGDLDLVSVDSGNNRMEVFHYDAATGFGLVGSFGTGSVPVSTFPWDTDGDGWIDLVSSDYSGGGISVLQNLGDGATFAPALTLLSGDQPHGLWGVDLTGDSQLDLLTANSGGSNVTLFQNQGGGVFGGGTSVGTGVTPYSVVGGDWNGDGLIDVATVNRTSGDVTLLLNGVATDAPVAAPEPALSGLLGVRPNPFRESAVVRFQLARPSGATLRVFDLRGRAVAGLHRGPLPPGIHQVSWDGRDARGHRVAAGVYFVRLDADGQSWTRKLLRLR